MSRGQVVELPERRDDALAQQHCTCANPRCDEQFFRSNGPGRRKEFCSADCRRTAERDLRKILAQAEHHERQAEQLRARASAYLRTSLDEETPSTIAASPEQVQLALEAVAEIRGMARFLPGHQGEFAGDLLRLFEAVEPVVTQVRASEV